MRTIARSVTISLTIMALAAFAPQFASAKFGGGDVVYKPKGAGQVLFRHEYHVNLKGQKCTNCHYKPFQMSKDSYEMNMNALSKGQFCGLCHNGKNAFDLTPAENCNKCHK